MERLDRRKIKLFKRNGLYYVDSGRVSCGMTKENALNFYRIWVIIIARDRFGFKPKSKLR